jgi:hypothetical protein
LIDAEQALAPDQVTEAGAVVPIAELPGLLERIGLQRDVAVTVAGKVRELAAGGAR